MSQAQARIEQTNQILDALKRPLEKRDRDRERMATQTDRDIEILAQNREDEKMMDSLKKWLDSPKVASTHRTAA